MIVIYIAAWVALAILNAGFLQADIQSHYPEYAQEEYRGDLAEAIGLSLVPAMWLITPFMTGFYEHGWTLRRPR